MSAILTGREICRRRELMRDAAPELYEALRKLEAEVGMLRAFEDAVREAICNTNYSCLMERAEQARAALAKARGES